MRVILTVYGGKGHSGLPKYFYFLAKHLALNNIDVEVLLDSEDRLERFWEVVGAIDGYPLPKPQVLGPKVTGMLSKAYYSRNIAEYLYDKDFSVLHSCDVLPYFYLKNKNRKPVVHQPFSNELFQIGKHDIRRMFFFTLRSCGQLADALAVVGEWQMDDMLKAYDIERDKAFVLPVGIDVDFVRSLATTREKARELIGIPEDAFVALSVNILDACKGIDYLIKSFTLLKNYAPNPLLYVTSTGPEEENLHRLVHSLGLQQYVVFTGDLPETKLYNYYAAADVYIHPTLLDGSSMGIMEAEALGLPIISTHQEFLIDGNGFIVPEKSPSALAGAILKMYGSDRVKMGKRSREIVSQYDFKVIAKKAIAKYEEII